MSPVIIAWLVVGGSSTVGVAESVLSLSKSRIDPFVHSRMCYWLWICLEGLNRDVRCMCVCDADY